MIKKKQKPLLIAAAGCLSAAAILSVFGQPAEADSGKFFGTDTPAEGIGRIARNDEEASRDIGCPDWDLESPVYIGWDGRTMSPMELDMVARIMSREFCGCSRECIDAGYDSIMRRWECGYWGDTLFEVLSAVEENGAWAYTTYPLIYDGKPIENYDWFRSYCIERFASGPQWAPEAKYFNLGGYAGWAVPMYELDGVFFSASPYLEGWY